MKSSSDRLLIFVPRLIAGFSSGSNSLLEIEGGTLIKIFLCGCFLLLTVERIACQESFLGQGPAATPLQTIQTEDLPGDSASAGTVIGSSFRRQVLARTREPQLDHF